MSLFRQVDKHKSRPDSPPSFVGFPLVNMLISLKKISLSFSAWWRNWLPWIPACVHHIIPGRAVGCSMGRTGWWQKVSEPKSLCEGRGCVKLSLGFPGGGSFYISALLSTNVDICRDQSCAGTFFFNHNKYCMLEIWLSKSNLKRIMKTVCKQPHNSLHLFSRYHLCEHLLWLWLCTILWWG